MSKSLAFVSNVLDFLMPKMVHVCLENPNAILVIEWWSKPEEISKYRTAKCKDQQLVYISMQLLDLTNWATTNVLGGLAPYY